MATADVHTVLEGEEEVVLNKMATDDVRTVLEGEEEVVLMTMDEYDAYTALEGEEEVVLIQDLIMMDEYDAHTALEGEDDDDDFTLKDMRRLQATFAEEAINFLLLNSQVWTEDVDLNAYDISHCTVGFTQDVGKAIITIAYIQRIGYRKKFRMIVHRIKNADDYSQYIMNYPIQKSDSYFYNFLAWVAYTFDFTIYCLKAGKDYVDKARECISKYPDVLYFHLRGGWGQLLEYSKYMAELYDSLSGVICKELPTDDVLLPFMSAIEMMEKEERVCGGRWTILTPDQRQLREVRKRLCYRYEVVASIDPRRITTGYKVRLRKNPKKPKTLKEICPKAAEMLEQFRMKPKPDTDEIDELVEAIEKTRIAVELTDRSADSDGEAADAGPSKVIESKSVFIVNERFLEKKRSQNESPRSKKKRCLKVYSPTKQTEKVVRNLNEILDENVANKNYIKIADDVYAICPPGCDIDDEATRLIVLDTSSEEEDYDYVTLKEIEDEILKYVKKCKNRLNQNCESLVETPKEGVPSSDTLSSQLPEQECNLPPKCTGAIPKYKVQDKPAKPETSMPKVTSTVQSKVSDPKNPDEHDTQAEVEKDLLEDTELQEVEKYLSKEVAKDLLEDAELQEVEKYLSKVVITEKDLPKETDSTPLEISSPKKNRGPHTPTESPKKKSHRRRKKSRK